VKNKILGYGEDSLTLWALTKKLDTLLCLLGETTVDKSECLVFYRPSFGRAVGIGEFDFIIKTKRKTYFGESKWPLSEKKRREGNCVVTMKDCQINRHKEFAKLQSKDYSERSILKANLDFVKEKLDKTQQVNVLLIFTPKDSNKIVIKGEHVKNNKVVIHKVEFKVICMYPDSDSFDGNSNFLNL